MKKLLAALLIFIIFNPMAFAQSATPAREMWGADNAVYTIAVDGDYTYIGGDFTYVGPTTGKVAKLQSGSTTPDMYFPPISAGNIYAAVADGAGGFYILKDEEHISENWSNCLVHIKADGTTDEKWKPEPNGRVTIIAVSGSDIFVYGTFTSIGGYARNGLAKLNNTDGKADPNWDPEKYGIRKGYLNSMIVHQGNLYLGGQFSYIGGELRYSLAKLNTTDGKVDTLWNPLCSGHVNDLAAVGNYIYAGGYFQSIKGKPAKYLARINADDGEPDTSWNPGCQSAIYRVFNHDGNIFVSGQFLDSKGVEKGSIRVTADGKIDTLWDPQVQGRIIGVHGNYVYFTKNLDGYSSSFYRIDRFSSTDAKRDTSWFIYADNHAGSVFASGDNLYICGIFNSIGGVLRNHLARISNVTGLADNTWDPDVNERVNKIITDGNYIYAVGNFTSVGGTPFNRIARISKTNGKADTDWNPNANRTVYSIVVNGDDVFTGGDFTTIGDKKIKRIAKLSKTTGLPDTLWNPAPDSTVNTIAINGSYVYAAGKFRYRVEKTAYMAKYIAKYNYNDGKADITFNPKLDVRGGINTILILGNNIYTSSGGSNFYDSYDSPAKINIADGKVDTVWKPGTTSQIRSFIADGDDIYVGGDFYGLGGSAISYLAKLNSTDGKADLAWDTKLNGEIYAIAVNGKDIYAGGSFDASDSYIPLNNFALFTDRTVSVDDDEEIPSVPENYSLALNYPNPFTSTTISYTLPSQADVRLTVYNIHGKEIARLVNETQSSGTHDIQWNASGLSSGIYFYRLEVKSPDGRNAFSSVHKMVLMK